MPLRRFSIWKFLLVFAVLLLGCFAGSVGWSHYWRNRIFPGVRVEAVSVGGLTEREAEKRIISIREKFLSSTVTLVFEEQQWQISRHELGFQINSEEIAHRAFLVGREGPFYKHLVEFWRANFSQVFIPLEMKLDRSRARVVLEHLLGDKISNPENARLVIKDNDQVVVIPSKSGKVIDFNKVISDVSKSSQKTLSDKIFLHLREQEPEVQTEDILAMKINGLLSSYTTYFNPSLVNRTYNINVAADALNNCLIKPGEIFSFNKVVGPRSKEAGYKEALVIVKDQFIPGIGGGVCQVSSTLYNAALLAGLEIVERSNHSLPVGYVPLGRDATVIYGVQDLKFRNNTSGYLYIRTLVRKNVLVVKIFGNTNEKKSIWLESIVDKVLEPKIIKKEDPNLYRGKTVIERDGVRGYQVRVFQILKGSNGYVKRLISNDLYRPVDQIVRVGTMPEPENQIIPGDISQPQNQVNEQPSDANNSGNDLNNASNNDNGKQINNNDGQQMSKQQNEEQ